MLEALDKILPKERIRARFIDVISFASDAGFYYLVPKAVVLPVNELEVISLFKFSHQHKIPLVFRTGGTNLSGQSITDGILVDLSQFWNKLTIEESGNIVRVQPGVTGSMVNTRLKKHKRKIGPDPSSINAAMIGGILSNNASGMCCGVKLNSYHTTKNIRFVLPNGKIFDTGKVDDYLKFYSECPELYVTLKDIKNEIFSNEPLYSRIRHKYKTKNTVGYSLNAFVDFEHPLDILAHLLIGAEGTLAFISEAVLETVPDYPYKSTALLYFHNIYGACNAIALLTDLGAAMVELMDRASLRAVEDIAGMPLIVKNLPEHAAALLIEFQGNSIEEVNAAVSDVLISAREFALFAPPIFTTDRYEREFLWKVRKGMFPAVGAVRASGTTVILEDLYFPVQRLGDAILELQMLFTKYQYHNAIIFGHAKDGNIHFVITQSFGVSNEVERYDLFLREVVNLVVFKYDGSLKAEHGTGRNMAPFVETEWGGDAYAIMKRIKLAVDPDELLNPGVIINKDKEIHIKNLKALPSVESEVDKCIECGYCEHKCPSRDITTSPRRRIVIRRALKQLSNTGDNAHYKTLLQQSKYDVIETCAVDGLCASACPVDINTADLVKRLRRENHSWFLNTVVFQIARSFKKTEWILIFLLRVGCKLNYFLGSNTMHRITKNLRKVIPAIPLWINQINIPPNLSKLIVNTKISGDAVIYFPSCISRMLGTYEGKEKNIIETFLSICNKAQIDVIHFNSFSGSCCGQIFSSKGFKDAYHFIANRIVNKLWELSLEGRYRIVIDVSSCAYTLHTMRSVLDAQNMIKYDRLIIMDSIDFMHDHVMPVVKKLNVKEDIVLHPVCSLEKMKTGKKFIALAKRFAKKVTIPENSGCCGMAGDRGFLFPELTLSATKYEATEVISRNHDGYYSSTRTCEIALSDATKKNYVSILYLIDETVIN